MNRLVKGVEGIEKGLCFQPGPQILSTVFMFFKGLLCIDGTVGGGGGGGWLMTRLLLDPRRMEIDFNKIDRIDRNGVSWGSPLMQK